MLEPLELVDALARGFISDRLSGLKLVITAGPTREAIDPVRYFSNRSSGRMAYAVSRAAAEAGGNVVLVSGPTQLHQPERIRCQPVTTAAEMHDAVMREIEDAEIFIAAAAVADYRCSQAAIQKIKKDNDELTLLLEKNPDILAAVAARKLVITSYSIHYTKLYEPGEI